MSYWDENVLTNDVMDLLSEIDEADLYMDSLELMTEGRKFYKTAVVHRYAGAV